jgi:hypothetical protein
MILACEILLELITISDKCSRENNTTKFTSNTFVFPRMLCHLHGQRKKDDLAGEAKEIFVYT